MVRHALTLASITAVCLASFASTACSHAAHAPATAASVPAKSGKATKTAKAAKAKAPNAKTDSESTDEKAETASASEPTEAAPAVRKLGDYHVYQYSGTFSKEPISLTEQVVAEEEGHVLVVDFVLQEGNQMSALRVRMRGDEEILKVSRMTENGEVDATKEDYDAMMKRTAFVPDSNDEALGTEHTSCMVGNEQVDCDVTTYQVTIGRKHAKLSITTSAQVPGRDIGGDVVAKDGKVLYSARLVERGNQPPVVESLARADVRFMPEGP